MLSPRTGLSAAMLALEGYGSESDSAVEDPPPRHVDATTATATATATTTATGGIPALLVILPEGDEDDHDHDERNDGAVTNGRGDRMRAPPTSDSHGGNGTSTIDGGGGDGGYPTSNGAAVDVEDDDGDSGEGGAAAAGGGGVTKRRKRRRWDDPSGGGGGARWSPLPPPDPPPTVDDDPSGSHPREDRTARLRDWLSRRARAQRERRERLSTAKGGGCVGDDDDDDDDDDDRRLRRLGGKLETLYDRFHGRKKRGGGRDGADDDGGADAPTAVPSSFSAHLKSQREFGNPHLLGTIVEHFRIRPLESNAGNHFKGFEYADRLMAAEERARIVRGAAIYDAGMADGTGGMPGSGT